MGTHTIAAVPPTPSPSPFLSEGNTFPLPLKRGHLLPSSQKGSPSPFLSMCLSHLLLVLREGIKDETDGFIIQYLSSNWIANRPAGEKSHQLVQTKEREIERSAKLSRAKRQTANLWYCVEDISFSPRRLYLSLQPTDV